MGPEQAPRETKPRIVVADDDADMLRLMERAFERRGFEVEVARDGQSLLRRLDSGTMPPDLVVTDVQMPGASGIDVLARVRGLGLRVPVILVTAYPHRALEDRALGLGAVDVLSKPFPMGDLCDLAQVALRDHRS